MQYKVISADNHIMEPRDLFVTRMPEKYRDSARLVTIGPRISAERHISTMRAGKMRSARNAINALTSLTRNMLPVTRKPLKPKKAGTIMKAADQKISQNGSSKSFIP